MNGNEHSASSNVSTSSLFFAAKHDSWQQKEGESLIPPFALLHFQTASKSSLEELDWRSNGEHLVRGRQPLEAKM